MTGTADGVAVLETVAGPGEPAPLDHVHRSYDEVFYVIEGEFEVRVGDRLARVSAGSVVTAPRGSLHAFKNCSDSERPRANRRSSRSSGSHAGGQWAGVATPGPLTPDGLAQMYQAHDIILVPPAANAEAVHPGTCDMTSGDE